MKPHEKVIYTLALVFGVLLSVAGLTMLVVGLYRGSELRIWGAVLLVSGIIEIIGVGLLLWTDGEKKK